MKPTILRLNGVEIAALTMGSYETIPDGVIFPCGPVTVVHPLVEGSVFRNGWHSWSFAGWIRKWTRRLLDSSQGCSPMADHPSCFASDRVLSSGLAAVGDPEGEALLLGALGPGGWIEVEGEVIRGFYEGKPSDWFLGYGKTAKLFLRYVSILNRRLAKPKNTSPPRVWCSWYSYYREISEEKLLAVVEGLKGLPVDVVQIDDGWQVNIGDWEPNERFPRGLKPLANAIRQAGFVPGIWLAPFIAHSTSQLVRKHPNWVLRDGKGKPVIAGENWGGPFYALDVSQADAISWVEDELFRLRSHGFSYLKLDFLYAGALPGQGESPEISYRNALGRLKEAWGDGYVLACGAPIIASLGLCDGLRIGPDVAPYWRDSSGRLTAPGAGNAVATSASRLWLKPAVHLDPDVVFFRSRYNLLTEREKQILLDLAAIAGFKGTSDPPEWLDKLEVEAMREFLVRSHSVRQTGFYRFEVDGREVDFRPFAERE